MTRLEGVFRFERLLLFDCEFTCWEDSLPSQWADPRRPAELIEIALVEYTLSAELIGECLHSLVRPRVNRDLSRYCTTLTGIRQAEVEFAPALPDVLGRIESWLSWPGRSRVPICAWGTGDFPLIEQDARRNGCGVPFGRAQEISLPELYRSVVSPDAFGDGERDTIRRNLGLPLCEGRHRAVADALDLAMFLRHLRSLVA